ncbi:MAG: DUF2442 domain-containing protein [Verrucomicrobiota bacterium]
MSILIAPKADEHVKDVTVTSSTLTVALADGRTISVPLNWFPRLANASSEDRAVWEICGAGYGIYWPRIDEHLSVEGLLRGAPAPR